VLEGGLEITDIRSLPGVVAVNAAGSAAKEGDLRLEVELAPGAEAHETLSAAFRAGLGVRRFESREPGLHEAFLLLTGSGPRLPEVAGA
jgi:ABC-2 type transport system ATP-binding protein